MECVVCRGLPEFVNVSDETPQTLLALPVRLCETDASRFDYRGRSRPNAHILDSGGFSEFAHDLIICPVTQLLVRKHVNVLTDKPDGTITQQQVSTTNMF